MCILLLIMGTLHAMAKNMQPLMEEIEVLACAISLC